MRTKKEIIKYMNDYIKAHDKAIDKQCFADAMLMERDIRLMEWVLDD